MRPLAEVRAPGGVVLEELLPDGPGNGVVEYVGGVVGGQGAPRAELGVGEEEHEVLPLVADVVALEAEGGAEPVEATCVPSNSKLQLTTNNLGDLNIATTKRLSTTTSYRFQKTKAQMN